MSLDSRFQMAMLNFFLNAEFTPKTDYFFVYKGQPYLSKIPLYGFCQKALISDWDGIFEKRGETPLYLQFLYKLAEKIGRKESEVDRIDKRIERQEDVPIGEKEFTKLFSDLSYEDYVDAAFEVADYFYENCLVRGAREFIQKVKGMNYLPGINSGCSELPLKIVGEKIGILKDNVYGSSFIFHNGKLINIHLNLGYRKPEKRDFFLRKNIFTRHGCHFVIEDDITLNKSLIKAGINPLIIVKEMRREEVKADVATCCPEAREDLLNLIPKVYRFEYGWIATQLIDEKTQKNLFDIAKKIRDIAEKSSQEINFSMVEEFAREAMKAVEIKERHYLISDVATTKNLIGRLITTRDLKVCKNLIDKIFDVFKSCDLPEVNAIKNFLED